MLTDAATPPYDAKTGPAPRIDLGAVRRLRYVVVHGCGSGDGHATVPEARTDVEVSRDGRTWRHLTLGNERVGLYAFDCFGPVSSAARYVRLRGRTESVREVAVF